MQRRKRQFREAMRREGEPVPSYKVARSRAWSVHTQQSISVVQSAMGTIRAMRAIRSVEPKPDGSHKLEIASMTIAAFHDLMARAKEASATRP